MIETKKFNEKSIKEVLDIYNTNTVFTPYCFPLTEDIFRERVCGREAFEPEGFFVGYRDGKPEGFIHAGFLERLKEKNTGSIFMFMSRDREVSQKLLENATDYLRSRRANIIHALSGGLAGDYFYAGVFMGMEVCCWVGFYNVVSTLEKNGFELSLHGFIMQKELRMYPEVEEPKCDVRIEVTSEEEGCPELFTNGEVKALAGDTQIGFCKFHVLNRLSEHLGKRIGQIGIAVDSPYRRRRIGSAILTRAHEELYKMGARKVILATNYELYPALQMYLKLGYVKELIDLKCFTKNYSV